MTLDEEFGPTPNYCYGRFSFQDPRVFKPQMSPVVYQKQKTVAYNKHVHRLLDKTKGYRFNYTT